MYGSVRNDVTMMHGEDTDRPEIIIAVGCILPRSRVTDEMQIIPSLVIHFTNYLDFGLRFGIAEK